MSNTESTVADNPLALSDDKVDELLLSNASTIIKDKEEESIDTETKEESVTEETVAEDNQEEKVAEETPTEEKSTETSEIDYKSEYERLLRPFKANNKEVKVESVDEAIALMQMGANYNKKMNALKPNLKLLKMLERHSLLDENKLSYLIDLDQKNPEAIRKLIKDSGIDPIEVDVTSESNYVPPPRKVSDTEVELDNVLEDIKSSSAFARTTEVITQKMDTASRQVFLEHPALIKVINDHIENGIYDQIMQNVEREKLFGRLAGMSDLEAYRTVGDQMNAKGAFNKPATSNAKDTSTKPDAVADKRRAAAPTKAKPSKTVQPDFNPLSLSDEEFEKISHKYF